ncbi:hypothetical protein [Streptomyces sp. MMS24-I29]|uniref:hypothetical protein n=1 Tax=Streptomyces sp. MMS24-I29 TaxID=3351480 RepID=UPI003C798F71
MPDRSRPDSTPLCTGPPGAYTTLCRPPPAARRQLLALDAARYRDQRLQADLPSDDDWHVRWATGSQVSTALVRTLIGHTAAVNSVAVVELEGRPHAVTASDDGSVRVWDLTTGSCLTAYHLPAATRAVTVTADGTVVLGVGHDVVVLSLAPPRPEASMTSPATAPLRIVAVHGVGNSFGPEVSGTRLEELRTLKARAWARQLAGGLNVAPDRVDLNFAYYADKLVTGPVAQGAGNPDALNDPLAQEMLTAWARELGVTEEMSQGHATVPLRGLSSWAARKFDLAEGPLRVFIPLLFREVAAYLRAEDAPERVAARDEVALRIARHVPRIVIAHSLGSVVAYEALHAHPELRPELFLTLGSPLALPRAVFDRLVPAPQGAGPARRGGLPARRNALGQHRRPR